MATVQALKNRADSFGGLQILPQYISDVPAVEYAESPTWRIKPDWYNDFEYAVKDDAYSQWIHRPRIQSIYYEGPSYRGKPTKVFAYLGIPEVAEGEKLPAVILVHGGDGTAFYDWVELWTSRNYVAIAMDVCGCIPVLQPGSNHWIPIPEAGGPSGWHSCFEQIDQPIFDQWPFYAVNAIARARTLLDSIPEVDNSRVMITGVSWGGFLTCLTAGLDDRYVLAAPIYGCGFLKEKSLWMETLRQPEFSDWNHNFDPAHYLNRASMPLLWVCGTNDGAYPLSSQQKSASLVQGKVNSSVTLRMPHGHGGWGELPEAVRYAADFYCKNQGSEFPCFTSVTVENGSLVVSGKSFLPLERVELLYTCDEETEEKNWVALEWDVLPGKVSSSGSNFVAAAVLPEGVRQALLNCFDCRNIAFSSPMVIWQDGNPVICRA